MVINSSGVWDTARVLKINKNTVINTLKKADNLFQVNPNFQTPASDTQIFVPEARLKQVNSGHLSKKVELTLDLVCG